MYKMARHSSVLLPTIKMVRFFGVASLLLFSYTALVAADTMPRVPIAETNNVGAMLQGRDTCSEPYDTQLNQLSYSPYAQRSALMVRRAVAQAPSVATVWLAKIINVRAYFNSRSLIVLLTMDLTQAVRMGGAAGQS